ncbi:hypothetical protein PV326_007817, partial [Microctonus aethiopoides]
TSQMEGLELCFQKPCGKKFFSASKIQCGGQNHVTNDDFKKINRFSSNLVYEGFQGCSSRIQDQIHEIQDGGSNMVDEIFEHRSFLTKSGIQGFFGLIFSKSSPITWFWPPHWILLALKKGLPYGF